MNTTNHTNSNPFVSLLRKTSVKSGCCKSATLACMMSLLLGSCMTKQTAYSVVTAPMTEDLEKKVLSENRLSGAALGALGGAVAGAGAGALIAVASGQDPRKGAIAGGIAGLVGGGIVGANEGDKKGKQIVATSLGRDNLRKLTQAAREQNARTARFNSELRRQIDTASKEPDPKLRKQALDSLAAQGKSEYKQVEKRLNMRNEALNNPQWNNNEKSEYKAATKSLESESRLLLASVERASKLSQATVF